MSLVALPGVGRSFIGPDPWNTSINFPAGTTLTVDAALEGVSYIGHAVTSDGGSHTIDTGGSSSIGWRVQGSTFIQPGSTVVVGVGNILTGTGPPVRANHSANAFIFDASKTMVGAASSPIPFTAWQTSVPDAGSKTIANGDMIAISIQMTTRVSADVIQPAFHQGVVAVSLPAVTSYLAAAYVAQNVVPNAVITFNDGAIGWISGSQIYSTMAVRTWNSTAGTKEYGQLFSLPFPYKVYGIYGWMAFSNDCDLVLYSDPLGTPAADRTLTVDSQGVSSLNGRRFEVLLPTPYQVAANQPIVVAMKPGAANVSGYYKTLDNASHRVTDPWGTAGYGVSRGTGAFSDANSSLDHYYLGLLVGAYEHGVSPTYGLGI